MRTVYVLTSFALGVLTGAVLLGGLPTATPGHAHASTARKATIRTLSDAPRRALPKKKATIRILAEGENAFLGHLPMVAGAKVPVHRDASEEYIVITRGQGTITIDGDSAAVGVGSAIYMPAGAEVTFQNGSETLEGYQVFAGPESAKKYDGWQEAPQKACCPGCAKANAR